MLLGIVVKGGGDFFEPEAFGAVDPDAGALASEKVQGQNGQPFLTVF